MNDKVLAISGACGRLGEAFAYSAVGAGFKVVLGDINKEKGLELAKVLGPSRACYCLLDVASEESIKNFMDEGFKHFGAINNAVHCAYPQSKSWGTPFGELKEQDLKENLFSQLGGSILFSQEVIKHFEKIGGGNLVLISSIQGVSSPKFKHYKGTSITSPIEYSAIKAGVISITKYLAKLKGSKNIRVNCISPGGILDDQPSEFIDNYREDCLSKGLLNSSDISGSLLFLLSEDSRFINGQNIIVDDGWSL